MTFNLYDFMQDVVHVQSTACRLTFPYLTDLYIVYNIYSKAHHNQMVCTVFRLDFIPLFKISTNIFGKKIIFL